MESEKRGIENKVTVYEVPSFVAAVEFAKNELTGTDHSDYYFVDIDKTLDTKRSMRYPIISKFEKSVYPDEHMNGLKDLQEISNGHVCIATNRRLSDPLWNSDGVIRELSKRKKDHDLIIPVFTNLNRLIPIHNEEYDRIERWLMTKYRRNTGRNIRLVVISDKDIPGVSFYEGFFLRKLRDLLVSNGVTENVSLIHLQICYPGLFGMF